MDHRIAAVAPLLDTFGVSHVPYRDGLLVLLASPAGGHAGIISCHGDFLALHTPRLLMAPPARHDEVARFVGKMNYWTVFGAWGLDLDGEVNFHVALPLGDPPVQADIDHLLHSTLAALDSTLPRLMPVAFGDTKACEALGEGDATPFIDPDEAPPSPSELEEAEQRIRELLDSGEQEE